MDKQMETVQLLARFKLQVKRSLSQSVDLERLSRDPAYAKQKLSEIEDMAEDEGLLIMVLRLRDLLIPPVAETAQESTPPLPEANKKTAETRNYLLGARAW